MLKVITVDSVEMKSKRLLQTGLEPATFCSEDRCSAIEPLKHFNSLSHIFVYKFVFVIFRIKGYVVIKKNNEDEATRSECPSPMAWPTPSTSIIWERPHSYPHFEKQSDASEMPFPFALMHTSRGGCGPSIDNSEIIGT